jgi:hypothetical protein
VNGNGLLDCEKLLLIESNIPAILCKPITKRSHIDGSHGVTSRFFDSQFLKYKLTRTSTKMHFLIMLYVCSCVLVKLQHLVHKDYVKTLSDREHITEDFVDSFVNHYLKDVVDGSQKEGGWPNWTDWVNSPVGRPAETYSVSKVAVIAYVSALHNTLVAQPGSGKKINVFSCDPGFVPTDLNNNTGTKTVEEGADTPVWLALHSPEEGIGKFWTERKVVDF